MKVKSIAEINPPAASSIDRRSFIDYIDTAAVSEGRLNSVQHLNTAFPSRAQREVHTDDILISSVRPNLMHNFFVTQNENGMIASTGFVHLRVKQGSEIVPRFLYYYLTMPSKISYYTRIANCSQSAYPSFSKEVIENIEVPNVPVPIQLRIAGILGSLDEKIEVNRRKIAELEALAKTIYDYWFVQYDFPDANGLPYKSSGGKMVLDNQLKREIPEGWETKSVADCGTFYRGVSYSKSNELSDKDKGVIEVFRGNNIANGYVVNDSNKVFIPRTMVSYSQMLKKGQVLIAMSSGSKDHVGKAGLVTTSVPNCAFGAFCTAFEPKEQLKSFMYSFFRSTTYRTFIKQICSGTGINNLKPDHMMTKLFALPNDNGIIELFNTIEYPIYSQIMQLDVDSKTIVKIRDYLLPLLMNGQVTVK